MEETDTAVTQGDRTRHGDIVAMARPDYDAELGAIETSRNDAKTSHVASSAMTENMSSMEGMSERQIDMDEHDNRPMQGMTVPLSSGSMSEETSITSAHVTERGFDASTLQVDAPVEDVSHLEVDTPEGIARTDTRVDAAAMSHSLPGENVPLADSSSISAIRGEGAGHAQDAVAIDLREGSSADRGSRLDAMAPDVPGNSPSIAEAVRAEGASSTDESIRDGVVQTELASGSGDDVHDVMLAGATVPAAPSSTEKRVPMDSRERYADLTGVVGSPGNASPDEAASIPADATTDAGAIDASSLVRVAHGERAEEASTKSMAGGNDVVGVVQADMAAARPADETHDVMLTGATVPGASSSDHGQMPVGEVRPEDEDRPAMKPGKHRHRQVPQPPPIDDMPREDTE